MALLHKNNRSVDSRKDFVKQQQNDKNKQSEDSRLHNPVTVAPETNPDGTINPQGIQSGPNQNEFKLSGQSPKTPNPVDEAKRRDAEHLKVIERTRNADSKEDRQKADAEKRQEDQKSRNAERQEDDRRRQEENNRRQEEEDRKNDR